MHIYRIIGAHGVMPQLCKGGACPSVILADNGEVFVQGALPSESEKKSLEAPQGEGFVRMSKETFEKLARHTLAE